MDPLLRLTIFLDRFRRNPWSRTKVICALGILIGALIIVAIDKLGYWPEALRVERGGGTRSIFHR